MRVLQKYESKNDIAVLKMRGIGLGYVCTANKITRTFGPITMRKAIERFTEFVCELGLKNPDETYKKFKPETPYYRNGELDTIQF